MKKVWIIETDGVRGIFTQQRMVLVCGLSISSRKVRSGVISTLIIVIFDIEVDQFTEVYPQSAAWIIDVLSIQRLV